jgi:hypothetical protein
MKLFTIESSKIDTNYFKTSFWGKLYFIASSTTKTGRHDIAAILLQVALKHQK